MVGGDCFAPAGGPRRGVDPGGGGLRPKSTAVPSPLQVHPWKRRPLTLHQYVHRCVVTHAGVVDAARTRLDRISDTEREEDKVTQFGHLLGPQRRNKGHFPIGIGGRASQRSSRRPSSARIGRDREMRISSAAPCAARGAPLQPKIGLPYQLYVSAPRAKFGSLGWRVGCGRCALPKSGILCGINPRLCNSEELWTPSSLATAFFAGSVPGGSPSRNP